MAAIDDLIAQIEDPALRERITREVGELQRTRKFGLVFERHLPELLPVYSAKPRRGDLVAKRGGSLTETWLVLKVERDHVHGLKRGAKQPETLAAEELVVVRQIGDPIFPSRRPSRPFCRQGNEPRRAEDAPCATPCRTRASPAQGRLASQGASSRTWSALPHHRELAGHNHLSEILHLNTADNSMGTALLDFIVLAR